MRSRSVRSKWFVILLLATILTACSNPDGNESHSGHNGAHTSEENIHDSHEGHDHAGKEMPSSVTWSIEPQAAKPGSEARIQLSVQGEDGKNITKFKISHDKPLHLLMISRDLQEFQHLHPEPDAQGNFIDKTTVSRGGDYMMIADYIPEGGLQTIRQYWWDDPQMPDEPPVLTPDTSLEQIVEGVKVRLDMSTVKAGQPSPLTFTFTEAESGKDVTDLQPYLGATGHLVIVDPRMDVYLHTHPLDGASTGPGSSFETTFPQAGIYKMWGQFQRGGKMLIVPFTVEVK